MAPGHTGKRSRVVCVRCHEKKVRCDLQLATDGDTRGRCTPCGSADSKCEFRPSNKGRRRKRLSENAVQPDLDSSRPHGQDRYLADASISEERRAIQTGIDGPVANEIDNRPNVGRFDAIDDIPPALQQSHLETYWEFIYPWCPVIDPGQDNLVEPILRHALALLAGSVNPPVIPHISLKQHYNRARYLFYAEDGPDTFTRIKAALLLSYSSMAPPNVGSMHSSFWWVGEAIRLAQDIGLHHEPPQGTSKAMTGLRRRIWWTLYARERIIALCQGKACIIDEDYIDIGPPVLEDFPPERMSDAALFERWVDLCNTIGFVNKQLFLSRRTGSGLPTHAIADRLTGWLRSLSPPPPLPISTDRTTAFDRHVHLLYLPYLMTIAAVYINTSQRLPEACVAAVIAGACMARIFEDFLARGCVRFLLDSGAWYVAVAALALRPLRSLDFLSEQAAAQVHLLSIALKELVTISTSAKMIDAGLERLLSKPDFEHALRTPLPGHDRSSNPARGHPSTLEDLCAGDGVLWSEFFPFVTAKTSPLLEAILTECQSSFPELWPEVDLNEFNSFLEEFSDGSFGIASSSTLT